MRIISGYKRGAKLLAPDSHITRPTSDRSRESLFNLIAHAAFARKNAHDDDGNSLQLSGAVIADFCAGTGALGLEALSRGASFVYFVEHHKDAVQILHKNIEHLNVKAQTKVIGKDYHHLTALPAMDIIFIDPPYQQANIVADLALFLRHHWIKQGGWVIYQSDGKSKLDPSLVPAPLVLRHEQTYRDACFHFFS